MEKLIDEILAIYRRIDKGEIEEEDEARKEIAIVFGKAIRWNLEEGVKKFRESVKVPMVKIDLTEKGKRNVD